MICQTLSCNSILKQGFLWALQVDLFASITIIWVLKAMWTSNSQYALYKNIIITFPNIKAQRWGYCFPEISLHLYQYSCKAGQGILHGIHLNQHLSSDNSIPGLSWPSKWSPESAKTKNTFRGLSFQPPVAQALRWVKSPFDYIWKTWIRSVLSRARTILFLG